MLYVGQRLQPEGANVFYDVLKAFAWRGLAVAGLGLLLSACASYEPAPNALGTPEQPVSASYIIGPGDGVQIFVWRNQELSVTVPVRPDGRISIPLIDDMPAAGRTPTELSRNIEKSLSQFIQNPIVTVMVNRFFGPPNRQIRVIGEATKPQALPYRSEMTVLDVMIDVGGLTDFAAGNRAILVRSVNGTNQSFRVRLADLIKDGDVTANVPVAPGDILIIPQSWF
jgi:polysaccharide export outer membrane protein